LPATTAELPENVAKVETLDLGGARQGRNDFQRPGYGGPCPPPGPAHRYFFKLYALDVTLPPRPAARQKDIEAAMQGHTLGTGRPTQREYLACLEGEVVRDTLFVRRLQPARDLKQLQFAVAGTCDRVARLVGTFHTHPYRADSAGRALKERGLSARDLETF